MRWADGVRWMREKAGSRAAVEPEAAPAAPAPTSRPIPDEYDGEVVEADEDGNVEVLTVQVGTESGSTASRRRVGRVDSGSRGPKPLPYVGAYNGQLVGLGQEA